MTQLPSDESLESLGKRIRQAKSAGTSTSRPSPGAGVGARVGVELIAGVAVGALGGFWLDKWLDTAPWLFIVCFLLGAAGGMMNIYRFATQETKENNNN